MSLNFKNRIALLYMLATAIMIAFAFGAVYFVVQETVYQNIDSDLAYEANKHTSEIKIVGDSIKIINKKEWEEREHREVQVNPVFIQILDKEGRFMDKSPNLKEQELYFREGASYGGHYNETLNQTSIRQVQVPIEVNSSLRGFIIAAMSLESSKMVLLNLRNVLFISYLLVLAILYFISRYLAGRNIAPITHITETTNRITKNNLNERVALPMHKDELFELSSSINELLQRIENAIERERQFTSDASHELRTPLASLRGTLEVLIRKPREQAEYEAKIAYSLSEIDRMTTTIEQLLLLARLDSNSNKNNTSVTLPLMAIVDDILLRHKTEITAKILKIDCTSDAPVEAAVPLYYSNLILDNSIHNAIKYSKIRGKITIKIHHTNTHLICEVKDNGIGIKQEDVGLVFNHFFRSEALDHKHITGNGLGLSIAKKAAEAIQAHLSVESELGQGMRFTISFLRES
ncbi:HAMP domain-containing sensor histidine kinase [Arenibacter sp. GZD96]|uniref:sensor histidine kinase n=1 Tax=Aurantibrevibacter litoralis TaxID=3106030 RepID=UPI002AFEB7F3|nr:HAMP domain-containing sensor histidine kinase [Arenibacter sp. GZD-96]MEA1785741.1 HAMP domain-containing sensor histidine kinase [Arenibacter sp. GZD-96]